MFQYEIAGAQPNMGPEMFLVFSPIVAAPVAALAAAAHLIFARFFAFRSGWQWASAGTMYSMVLLGLISPWLLLGPILVNPITLRLARTGDER